MDKSSTNVDKTNVDSSIDAIDAIDASKRPSSSVKTQGGKSKVLQLANQINDGKGFIGRI